MINLNGDIEMRKYSRYQQHKKAERRKDIFCASLMYLASFVLIGYFIALAY